jgi:CelD/BcsL family acetyltransferase involved in cellulose biosynthesis
VTLRARCFDAREARDHLISQWRQLTDASRRLDLSASCDWFWNHLDWISPPERELSFVTVHDGERVIGMFPIETRRINLSGIDVRCTGFIESPYGPLDTAVLTNDDGRQSAREFVAYLFDEMRGWSCFSTDGIDAQSPVGTALLMELSARGQIFDRGGEVRPFVSLADGWDSYVGSRSANFRRNLKRAIRELEEAGALDYRSESSVDRGIRIVEEVDRLSWRMAKQRDVVSNERLIAYCRRLYETFPDPGLHVVRYLALNDKPIASLYGLIHANVFYAIKVNYDLSAAEGSPGFVLLNRVFEELALQGMERIELMGKNQYLHRLGNASRQMARVLVFNRSARGRALGLAAVTARRLRPLRPVRGAQG